MIRKGAAPNGPGGWIQAHRFAEDHARVAQSWNVLRAGRTASEKLIQLGVELLLDLWMLRKEIPRPGQGHGRGLVAGEEQSHGLALDLIIGHPDGAFVLRGEEQRQQIRTAQPSRSSIRDHAVDRRIEDGAGSVDLTVLRQRQTHHEREQRRKDPREISQRDGKGVPDGLGFDEGAAPSGVGAR